MSDLPRPSADDFGRLVRVTTPDGEREVDIYSEEGFRVLSQLWTRSNWQNRLSYEVTWLGIPIIQLPEDMVVMQELIWKVRPDVIVESGVAHGGALVLYASILELLGRGRVIGVDIEIRKYNRLAIEAHPLSHRIELIEGDSLADETVDAVRSRIKPGERVMVALDSEPHARARAAESWSATPRSSRRTATSWCSTRSWRWWPTRPRPARAGTRTTRSRPCASSSTATTTSRSTAPTSGWRSPTARAASCGAAKPTEASLTPCCFARPRSPACYVVEPERIEDERGFFARTFSTDEFAAHGLDDARRPVQHVVQREGRHAARTALPGRAARRGQARALHARRDLRRGRRPATRLAELPALVRRRS